MNFKTTGWMGWSRQKNEEGVYEVYDRRYPWRILATAKTQREAREEAIKQYHALVARAAASYKYQ